MAGLRVHLPGARLFVWPRRASFFPLVVSSVDYTVLPQIIVSHLLEEPTTPRLFGCSSRNPSSQQVASTIHGSGWLLSGQEPVLPASWDGRGDGRHLLSIHSLPRNSAGDGLAGEGHAVPLNRHRHTRRESAFAFPKHSWETKEQICRRCTHTKSYYVKKNK